MVGSASNEKGNGIKTVQFSKQIQYEPGCPVASVLQSADALQ